MISSIPVSMEILFLAGYILFSTLLNLVALLISTFYSKKFNQSSPKVGFIIAIVLAILYMSILFMGKNSNTAVQILSLSALLGSGAASTLSILNLFFTMRSVQK